MPLKIFNKSNSSWSKTDSNPSVSFTGSGVISINHPAVNAIGLQSGQKVSIAQNDEDKRTFYLFVDKENGFVLRDYNKSKSLAFICAIIVKAACDNYNDDRKSVSGKLITEPQIIDKVKYYPIILPKAE